MLIADELAHGPNRVEAYAYQDGLLVASDWTSFTLRRDGEPRPNLPDSELNSPSPKKTP